jgi:hypothetical protein
MLFVARLVDLIILFTLAEGVFLVLRHRATGRGLAVREVVGFLGAGEGLLLAMRFGLAGNAALALAALATGGLLHGWFVAQRWRQ